MTQSLTYMLRVLIFILLEVSATADAVDQVYSWYGCLWERGQLDSPI